MFLGFVIVTIGLVFLLKNLGFISGDMWSIVWPCLVIWLGLSILLKRRKREKRWKKFGEKIHRFGKEVNKTFGGEE